MCGIVGYIGPRQAAGLLLEGLRRMEYRGYDSAGIAVVNGHGLEIMKAAGKLSMLEQELEAGMPSGTLGIGHTRWATHGAPTTPNAHPAHRPVGPHRRHPQRHHRELRRDPEDAGAPGPHLQVGDRHRGAGAPGGRVLRGQPRGVGRRRAARGGRGVRPGVHLGRRARGPGRGPEGLARCWSGVGENEWFVASDASPLLQYTRSVVYLDDGEMVVLTRDGYRVRNLETTRISKPVNQIDWDLAMVERNGYAHFMLKEICEQPESLCNTLRGHLLEEEGTARVSGLNLSDDQLKQVERIIITACGTSWHSGADRRVHAGGDGADPGRGRVRLGVPLPQSGGGPSDAGDRHLPVGRDRRYPGGDPRGQAAGRPDHRPGQRGGLDHRARGGRRHLPARRPRGGRGEHQGVHQPGGRAGAGDAPHRPAPEPEHPPGPRVHPGPRGSCRSRSRRSWSAPRSSSSWPSGSSAPRPTRSTWAAGSTSRWRSRARSS